MDNPVRGLQLSLQGWETVHPGTEDGLWRNRQGDVLSIQLKTQAPPLPAPLTDVDELRRWQRQVAAREQAALLSLDVIACGGQPAIRAFQKYQTSVVLGMLVFPLADFSYQVKILAKEFGTTGVRESTVMAMAHKQGKIARDTNEGWAADLYDANFKGPYVRTLADDEEYDSVFPDHPLTRVRKGILWLEGAVQFKAEVRDAEPFRGGPASRGRAWYQLGYWARAIADFDAALKANLGDSGTRFLRGRALLEAKDPRRALRDLKAVQEQWPDSEEVLAVLARACVETGQLQEALVAFDRALKVAPERPKLLLSRASTYLSVGSMVEAESDYETAVKLAPDNAEARAGRAACRRAAGRYPAAMADYNRAMALAPEDAPIWLAAVSTLVDMDRLDLALGRLAEFTARVPSCLRAWQELIHHLRRGGRLDEALQFANAAIEANRWGVAETVAQLFVLRARLQQELGRGDEGRHDLEEAWRQDPRLRPVSSN